jgi:hypothetical protein
MSDFSKALQDAQGLPELPDELSAQVPDILAQHGAQVPGVRRVAPNAPGKVPGGTEFDFEFYSARLIFGTEIVGYSNGNPDTTDRDDAERYKEIMDKILRAEAVLQRKTETFLKDGTFVLFIEWLEPKTRSKEGDTLTYEELLSPETPGNSPSAPEESSSSSDTDE